MRKSRILTFLFGRWPGAGQMYLGYMKRGISLMLAFCFVFAVSGVLGLGIFAFILPVIWFYAFFDTLNLRSMSYEFLPHDDFLFHLDSLNVRKVTEFFQRRHLLGGILLIALGVYILLYNIVLPYLAAYFSINLYPFFSFFSDLPALILAVVIILLGLRLIRESIPHKAIEDDYQEYQEYHDEDSTHPSES